MVCATVSLVVSADPTWVTERKSYSEEDGTNYYRYIFLMCVCASIATGKIICPFAYINGSLRQAKCGDSHRFILCPSSPKSCFLLGKNKHEGLVVKCWMLTQRRYSSHHSSVGIFVCPRAATTATWTLGDRRSHCRFLSPLDTCHTARVSLESETEQQLLQPLSCYGAP